MRSTRRGPLLWSAILVAVAALISMATVGLGVGTAAAPSSKPGTTFSTSSIENSAPARGVISTAGGTFTLTEEVGLGGSGSLSDIEAEIYTGGTDTLVTTAQAVVSQSVATWTVTGLSAASYYVVIHYTGAEDYPDRPILPVTNSGCDVSPCTMNFDQANEPAVRQLPTVDLYLGSSITGVVSNWANTAHLAGMRVTVGQFIGQSDTPDGQFTTTTAADGSWEISHLNGVAYTVQVSDPTGLYASVGWEQDSPTENPQYLMNISSPVDLYMPLASNIHGTVSAPGGSLADFAAGDVTAELYQDDGTSYGPVRSVPIVLVDGQYSYNVPGIANLGYYVQFTYISSTGFGTAETPKEYVDASGQTYVDNVSIPLTAPISAGGLIKVAESSQLYVVNAPDPTVGDSQLSLLFVGSQGILTDMGISSPAVVVTDQDLAVLIQGGENDLTNAIACTSGTTTNYYFAGSGELWPVGERLVNGLAVTNLTQPTCANIPMGSTHINNALFVKSSTSSTVWAINSDGQKIAMTSTADEDKLSAPDAPKILTVSADFISSLSTSTTVIYPGELVQSTNSSTVYLADGTSSLIAVNDSELLTSFGLSVTTVPYASVYLDTIESSALTDVVSCAGADYVGGSGRIWPISSTLVTSFDVTQLQAATCGGMASGSLSIDNALLVRDGSSPTTWYVDPAGIRHPVSSQPELVALAAPRTPVVITMAADFVDALPIGAAVVSSGDVVRDGASPAIYLVDGASKLIPIGNPQTGTDMGLASAVTVSDATVASRTIASSTLQSVVLCSGQFYVGGSGKLWPIASVLAYRLPVTVLDPTTCAALPKGTATIAKGLFVKSATSSSIWQLTGGQKVATSSMLTVQQLSSPGAPPYVVVPDAYIDAIPSAS